MTWCCSSPSATCGSTCWKRPILPEPDAWAQSGGGEEWEDEEDDYEMLRRMRMEMKEEMDGL